MTIVIDPTGSIGIRRRDQSTTMYTVAAAGNNGATATQLTTYSSINVVSVTSTTSDLGVKMPAGEEGDYFEIYSIDGNTLKVYDASGTELYFTGNRRYHMRFVNGTWHIPY